MTSRIANGQYAFGRTRRPAGFTLLFLVALFACAAVALFFEALFQDRLFFQRDLHAYYLPAKALLVRLVRETRGLPEWNPYFASGQPFAANPEHELYHPMTALLFVLPFRWAFRMQVILPVLGAGAAMYFLLRTLRRSRNAAGLGALLWAFGGYTLSTVNLLPILFAVAALPAVLAFAVRAFRTGRLRDAGGLALSFGLECLAGEPSTLLMTAPLVVAALASAAKPLRDAARPRRLVLPFAGLALGALIGAGTLLPGMLLMRKTIRAGGLSAFEANTWSMPAARLSELLYPWGLGRGEAAPTQFWGAPLYPGRDSPFLYSLYPGGLATLLAGAALGTAWRAKRRGLLAWPLVSLGGVALALGAHTPVWPAARTFVPLLGSIRFPEKFALVPAFALVVLAAFGLDAVLAGRRRAATRLLVALGAAAAVVAVGVLLLRGLALHGDPADWSRLGLSTKALRLAGTRLGLDLASWLGTAAAYAGALLLLRLRRSTGAAALLAVSAFDLVTSGRPLAATAPAPTEPPALFEAWLERRRPEDALAPVFHIAGWYFDFEIGAGSERPPRPALWGIPTTFELDFDLTELRWSSRARDAFMSLVSSDRATALQVLRRRGVSAIVAFRDDASGDGNLVMPTDPSGAVAAIRPLDGGRPFAFSPDTVARFDGEKRWASRVAELGASAARAVLLDASRTPPGAVPTPIPERFSKGAVGVLRREPTRIELDVDAPGPHPTLVALNQTWDEHWTAASGGRALAIFRTDIALSALLVPPGRHRVVLTYADPWVRRGLALSLLGALAALAAVAFGRRAPAGAEPRGSEREA